MDTTNSTDNSDLVRVVNRDGRESYIEIACGRGDDEWTIRAVRVGKGIEITRSTVYHGWVDPRSLRKWCKKLIRLSREIERAYPTDYPMGRPSPPTAPVLVGVAETADILGVTKQRVVQLAATKGFPAPIVRLRAGPVWATDDICQWGSERAARSLLKNGEAPR